MIPMKVKSFDLLSASNLLKNTGAEVPRVLLRFALFLLKDSFQCSLAVRLSANIRSFIPSAHGKTARVSGTAQPCCTIE